MFTRRRECGLMGGVLLAFIIAGCADSPVEPESERELLPELIVFSSSPSEEEQNLVRDLFVIAPDGSGLTRLTSDLRVAAASWSPDGRQLVFLSAVPGERNMFVINADGSGRRLLFDIFAGKALWSSDGKHILFSSPMEPAGLFVMSADGGEPRSVYPCADCTDFAWSPDGSRIAVTRVDHALRLMFIHIVNFDGTGSRALATGLLQESMPAWSPDGQVLAFAGVGPDDSISIYRARPDGTQLTRLTDGLALDWAPAFSRDGSEIAFESWRGGGSNLFIMNADGGDLRRLTDVPGVHRSPAWRP